MKVLLLAMFLPPDTGGERGWYIAKSLSKRGHKVVAVTNLQHHIKSFKLKPWSYRDGVLVVRRPMINAGYKGFWRRLVMFTSFALSTIPFLIKIGKHVDVIISRGPHPFLDVPSLLYFRIIGKPMVLDVTDLWPESLLVYLGAKEGLLRMLIFAGKLINKFLFRTSSAVITHTLGLARYFLRMYKPRKLKVIRGVIDIRLFRPVSREEAVKTIRDRSLLKVTASRSLLTFYAGTIGPFQDIRRILYVAEKLKECEFIILGEGEERPILEAECERKGLRNIRFMGLVPHDKVPYYLSLADICLLPLLNTSFLKISLPKKMLEYMACGKPIIYLGPHSEASTLIEKWGIGFVTSSTEELYAVLRELIKDKSCLRTMGEKARTVAEKLFTEEHVGERLERVLNEVLKETHSPIT